MRCLFLWSLGKFSSLTLLRLYCCMLMILYSSFTHAEQATLALAAFSYSWISLVSQSILQNLQFWFKEFSQPATVLGLASVFKIPANIWEW